MKKKPNWSSYPSVVNVLYHHLLNETQIGYFFRLCPHLFFLFSLSLSLSSSSSSSRSFHVSWPRPDVASTYAQFSSAFFFFFSSSFFSEGKEWSIICVHTFVIGYDDDFNVFVRQHQEKKIVVIMKMSIHISYCEWKEEKEIRVNIMP